MAIGKHSEPPMDQCIRLGPFKPIAMVAIALLTILPVTAVLRAITLSRYVPWNAMHHGCGHGDGGGCSRYCELAITTYGTKLGMRYLRRICIGR